MTQAVGDFPSWPMASACMCTGMCRRPPYRCSASSYPGYPDSVSYGPEVFLPLPEVLPVERVCEPRPLTGFRPGCMAHRPRREA
jgi:hypothetical protein